VPPWADSKSPGAVGGGAGEGAAGVAEELALQEGLGHGAAVDGDEGVGRAGRLVVNEPGDALLADAALARDEHGGVDGGYAPREVDHAAHRVGAGDQPRGGLVAVGCDRGELLAARAQGLLGLLEGVGEVGEVGLEAGVAEEGEGGGVVFAPVFGGTALDAAAGVAAAHALALDAVDGAAVAVRQVAAREGRDSPTHGRVAAAKLQEVLLGLVAVAPDGLGEGAALGRHAVVLGGLVHELPLEHVDAPARDAPVAGAVPGQGVAHGLGGAPAVGEAEAGEHRARGGLAQAVDQLAAQEAHRAGVHEQHALVGEAQHAPRGREVEQLAEVEVGRAHGGAGYRERGDRNDRPGPIILSGREPAPRRKALISWLARGLR
jgi:hypothetical protein